MDVTLSAASSVHTRQATFLSSCWGSSNELLLHECPTTRDGAAGTADGVNLLHLKWNWDMFQNEPCRELISQSSSIFASFSQVKKSDSRLTHVIEASRKYRSVIHACADRLQDEDLRRTFREIGMVWHLCEILFLDLHPPGILVNELLCWAQWHFADNSENVQLLFQSENPALHPLFWKTVTGFLMRGDTENAAVLLSTCCGIGDKEYTSVVLEVLRKIPRYSPGQLSHEFDIRWQAWNEECLQILRTGYFDERPELRQVLAILSGDEETILSLRGDETTWFNVIPALIFYTDPFMKDMDLATIARKCLASFKDEAASKTLIDQLLLPAFSFELMDVIKQACFLNDNWWFVAHFVDLLYAGNQLHQHQIQEEEKLREFLLLDYADSLMSHSSLWSVSIDYFDNCNRLGQERLQLMLARIPLTSERKAFFVLDVAEKRNLKILYRSICRTMAQKWLARSKLSAALVWGMRGEDNQVCSLVADLMLRQYATSTSFAGADVLTSLGSNMLISDRLTFLAKYFEFHQLREGKEYKAAADLLASLISSNISPHFFTPTLLMDCLPLLSGDQVLFDSEQSCQILAAFQDAVEFKAEETNDVVALKLNELKEQESKLRLSLGRSLAASLVL